MTTWKTVVQHKQAARAEAIANAKKQLEARKPTEDESVYLRATISEIVHNIEDRKWTAVDVVSAYIRQAIRAHEATNCLTEILFEQALKEAAELDTEFAATGRLRGPFHGVPISVKDPYNVHGYDSSIGYTSFANQPAQSDAHVIAQVRAAGALILAKTNIPQTMLTFECANPLFGCSTNPYNADFTPGGSSGGEAALLVQNGSALGLGSDTGGSLRIPAGYCGIYSLKPSALRTSLAGIRDPNPGFQTVPTVIGPMARSVEDVDRACRLLFEGRGPEHELAFRLPYREVKLPEKLRFGYYTSDLLIKSSPVCQRAVMQTVEALRSRGHECTEFEPTLAREAFYTFVNLLTADGYQTLFSLMGPDPKDSGLFLTTLGPKLPGFVRIFACWAIRTFAGDDIFATALNAARTKSTKELYALIEARDKLRERWYEQVWTKYNFDGIIAPVQACPAIPHGASATLSPLAAATTLYNIIDSPAGVIPVTHVDPSLDNLTDEWTKEPGHGSKLLENDLYRNKNAPYNVERMAGLPVGVQIVGKSFEDEKVLAMMRIVDEALGPRGFGPAAWIERNQSNHS